VNTFRSRLTVTASDVKQFLQLLAKEYHQPIAFPEYTEIRSRITDKIEKYLGDWFEDEFHVFVGKHSYYPVHIDNNYIQGRIVKGRLNVLLEGEPGHMQYYQTTDDYSGKTWKDTIQTDYQSLKPIDKVQCKYPAFVRTDILHDVHFNSCHKGKDRIMLSYPLYNHSWEQIVERFRK